MMVWRVGSEVCGGGEMWELVLVERFLHTGAMGTIWKPPSVLLDLFNFKVFLSLSFFVQSSARK